MTDSAGEVLVTGASGFIGRNVVRELLTRDKDSSVLVHKSPVDFPPYVKRVYTGDGNDAEKLACALANVDSVIHLAGRAHILQDDATDPLAEFRRVNVDATLHLAECAVAAGVRRFVFVSSIGVNGASTTERPFNHLDEANPQTPYALTKWEAEEALRRVVKGQDTELIIVRPPLVYGPGAPGNFARLMTVIQKGIPLPFGSIDNLRSQVFVGNLVSLLLACIETPQVPTSVVLVSDGDDQSTPGLIRQIASALGRPARLFPCPIGWLRLGGKLTGRLREVDQLTCSLQIDIGHTREMLGWTPPISMEVGLGLTVRNFGK